MNLSEIFIRRPVMTVLLNLAIVVAGALSLNFIPVAALPSYNTPVINVSANLPGASPEDMATVLAAPFGATLCADWGADVVKLDENNRRLVAAGLRTLRSGQGCEGIRAIFTAAGGMTLPAPFLTLAVGYGAAAAAFLRYRSSPRAATGQTTST